MALFSSSTTKLALTGFVTLSFLLLADERGAAPSTAQAQNFIEKLLTGNHRQPTRKKTRTTKKRASQSQSKKVPQTLEKPKTPIENTDSTAPSAPAVVPIPTPSPRNESQDKQDVSTPSPSETEKNPPVPTEKPAEQPATEPETTDKPPLPEVKPDHNQNGKEQVSPPEATQPIQKPDPDQPGRVYQVSCPAIMSGDVQGKLLPPVNEGEQCRIQSPIALSAIGKDAPLKFGGTVTTNCAMAVTLAQWSEEVKKAAADAYGADVKIEEIGTGSDFQCRKVNGASTGRISEHSFANALDIMSFKFSNGTKTELETGWNGSDNEKKFWRSVHAASCRLFMTVIGPDGDAAHRTNMHLDQGCHGKSCEARICQ